jgi:hypothetical protein
VTKKNETHISAELVTAHNISQVILIVLKGANLCVCVRARAFVDSRVSRKSFFFFFTCASGVCRQMLSNMAVLPACPKSDERTTFRLVECFGDAETVLDCVIFM